jgi:hypothetical protein
MFQSEGLGTVHSCPNMRRVFPAETANAAKRRLIKNFIEYSTERDWEIETSKSRAALLIIIEWTFADTEKSVGTEHKSMAPMPGLGTHDMAPKLRYVRRIEPIDLNSRRIKS